MRGLPPRDRGGRGLRVMPRGDIPAQRFFLPDMRQAAPGITPIARSNAWSMPSNSKW